MSEGIKGIEELPFPLRMDNVFDSQIQRIGCIGIEMPDDWRDPAAEWADAGPDLTDEIPSFSWQSWLSRRLPEAGQLRFGDRVGRYLWFYAEIRESGGGMETGDWDMLARKLCDMLIGRRYGAAIVGSNGIRMTAKDLGFDAFLNAAAKLLGAPMHQSRTAESIELERILHKGGIRSVYQPLFRLKDGSLYGYEALTRCPPDSPFDGPLALFRFAEKEGCSFALDRVARESAVRYGPPLTGKQKIFLNVNSGIMKDPQFVSGQTRQWLTERGLMPEQVVFELTERSSIDDFEEAKKTLGHYRSQGYEIAVDDAGRDIPPCKPSSN